jgi:serine/threonine protein kinase
MAPIKIKTLREILDVSPTPPLFATLYFLHEILQVLAYAHQRKIIHRDLKPSNMMVDKIGRIKLLDFGIARNAGATQDMTLPGSVLGTAAYMSPEQITGKKVTLHSDLFSLGIIAFEMLTGKHPFRGETMELTTQYILNVKIHKNLFPKQVPHALRRFVCKILEKKPSKRFQSAQEAADELSKIMEGFPRQLDVYMGQWLDSLSHPESKFEPPPQKKHKSYLYLAVGFITGIIVAASTSLFILN